MEKSNGLIKMQKLEMLGLNEAYRKCLAWFFAYPNKEISLSDLAKNLEISKTSARKIVLQLIQEEFLVKEELGKVWRIYSNKEHFYHKTIKISYHLEQIYLNLPGILKEIYKNIPNTLAIILFGSYRKGDDDEESDIDIAVEILGKKDIRIEELGIIPSLGYRKNVKVNLHIFSRNRIDLNLFNNIANGILLEGFLEVRP
jgi:predicted nucleotidyltransferase